MSHENAIESVRLKGEQYSSLYPGIVREIEEPTDTTKRRGRVRVEVLPMFKDIETERLPWAMPKWSGSFIRVPEVGETVWVFFEAGDILRPVYESGLIPIKKIDGDEVVDSSDDEEGINSSDIGDPIAYKTEADRLLAAVNDNKIDTDEPTLEADPEYPKCHRFITPGGFLVEVDDTVAEDGTSKQRLFVHHPSGAFLPSSSFCCLTCGLLFLPTPHVVLHGQCRPVTSPSSNVEDHGVGR